MDETSTAEVKDKGTSANEDSGIEDKVRGFLNKEVPRRKFEESALRGIGLAAFWREGFGAVKRLIFPTPSKTAEASADVVKPSSTPEGVASPPRSYPAGVANILTNSADSFTEMVEEKEPEWDQQKKLREDWLKLLLTSENFQAALDKTTELVINTENTNVRRSERADRDGSVAASLQEGNRVRGVPRDAETVDERDAGYSYWGIPIETAEHIDHTEKKYVSLEDLYDEVKKDNKAIDQIHFGFLRSDVVTPQPKPDLPDHITKL